ncbi:hypothetical protein DER45DRAFT_370278 [Fusarium avenaceum]|nr:hypothetical protein DER45DRAFT_370278 [Fusarium avenaceum]
MEAWWSRSGSFQFDVSFFSFPLLFALLVLFSFSPPPFFPLSLGSPGFLSRLLEISSVRVLNIFSPSIRSISTSRVTCIFCADFGGDSRRFCL